MLQDLVRHKVWANAALLRAISQHGPAATDDDLRTLTHHVILANRFWFAAVCQLPFDVNAESAVPITLGGVIDQFRKTHAAELTWLGDLSEQALERAVEPSRVPGRRISVGEATMQVCLHSHGHRAQAATRLRVLGRTPPAMDYVKWLAGRPGAQWG